MAAFFTSAGWEPLPAALRLDGLPGSCSSDEARLCRPWERDVQADKKGSLVAPLVLSAIKSELIAGGNAHVAWFTVNDRTVDIGIVGFIKQVVDIAL